MNRCPVCRAKYIGKQSCHRCKTDLSLLVKTEHEAKMHFQDALSAFENNDFNQMFFHAKRSFSLYRTERSAKILGCAALLSGRFESALFLWADSSVKNQPS